MTPRGGTYSEETRKRLKAVGAPPYERAVLGVNRWMVRKGFSENRDRLAEKMRLREQLRARIVGKLKRGAAVEPGIHTAWIETRERLKTR